MKTIKVGPNLQNIFCTGGQWSPLTPAPRLQTVLAWRGAEWREAGTKIEMVS